MTFRTMGVNVVLAGGDVRAKASARTLFQQWDRTFSRFRADSELNRVNRAPSSTVLVSPLFADVLRIALRAADANEGLVDPTLGAAIVAAGYDTHFRGAFDDARSPGTPRPGRRNEVVLHGRLLRRPPALLLT